MKRKLTTKHALITSVLALCLCVTMLVGSTFAWFTDTASTSVNSITSGNLHVEIHNESGKKIEKLEWKTADNRAQNEILWEPGCTYTLTPFKIVNTGNLALKYKIVVTGLDGDAELLDVIKFTYTEDGGAAKDINAIGEDGHLTAKGTATAESGTITISATMSKDADNKYQGKTLDGVKLNVYATQDTVESDSTGNQYDVNAEYAIPPEAIKVTTFDELKTAITNADGGETIRLCAGIDSNSALTISKSVAIDLNGFTLSSSAANTLKLSSGANVVISDTSADATGSLTNTYSGSADPMTVDLQGSGAVFTLESGMVQSNAKDNLYTLAIGSSKKVNCTVNIKGGTVTNPAGHVKSRAISASSGMVVNIYDGTVNGGLYALDTYAGSTSNIYGGKLFANALVARNDEYGKSYAIHAKGEATINVGSATAATTPDVKGIKFESNGPVTSLPTINLYKGEITNPIYSLEAKYNYSLFKLGITAGAPVTFTDNTAQYFLADDLQMVQNGSVWMVAAK